jgi:NADH dehydrogenase
MKFFIAGGTGFIGSHLIKFLSNKGYFDIRCLVRSEEKKKICESAGFEAVIGDITEDQSIENKLEGCQVVIHLVGIIEEKAKMTFQKVHVDGTKNLVDEAKKAGIRHIFYQSALGASVNSFSKYYTTKAEAEKIVRTSGIPYTIFRPSLVVGEGDGFTEKLKDLINLGPFIPIPGDGNARFQPLYVEDWIKCFLSLFSGGLPSASKIYEFGGPEHLTYNEIIIQLMEAMKVNKPLIHLPLGLIKLGLPFSNLIQKFGNVLKKKIPSATLEQLLLLQQDNICELNSVEKNFGFKPITYREALRLYINPKVY